MAGRGLPIIEMSGLQFGRLVVVSLSHLKPGRGAFWNCACECGTTKSINGSQLRSGAIVSCGCYRANSIRSMKTTHGLSKLGLGSYMSWSAMRRRCMSEKDFAFSHYGGRGIKVCDRWESFANFVADMGEPSHGETLDRIDVNGNYEPGNCRWASRAEQANNTRSNVRIKMSSGEPMTMAEFSRRSGIPYSRMRHQLKRGIRVFGNESIHVDYPKVHHE
jgi:hypothetical protein